MKKFTVYLTFVLSLNAVTLPAQIHNNGFEQLNASGNVSHWGKVLLLAVVIDSSGNSHGDSIVFDNQLYFPTTDAHSGLRAMEMRNGHNYTTGQGYAGGASLSDNDSVYNGFSTNLVGIQVQPTGLNFYYKYFPVNDDSASAQITVYDEAASPIGEGFLIMSGTMSNYTLANIPITYAAPGKAAFISLSFSTFYSEDGGVRQPSFGTRLLVDDVSLNTTTGIPAFTNDQALLTVYPNPVRNLLYFQTHSDDAMHYTIYAISGQLVRKGTVQPGATSITTYDLDNGLYTIELSSGSLVQRTRVVVNR